ncbi:MAG: SMP-30/gluconolactonase/LRE family protein [Pseudomonadota bacterium]
MRPTSLIVPGFMAALLSGCSGSLQIKDNTTASGVDPASNSYVRSTLVDGSDFHGIHGITEGPDGALFAGSVVGQSIYRIDRLTGEVTVEVPSPDGSADDLVFGPDGQLYWTDILRGEVKTRNEAGDIVIIASGLPGANAIDFHPDGRLFVTQVFQGDALNEIDPSGMRPPRQVVSDMGGLNGFEIGEDGYLYGPLWFRDQVVRVDVDTGDLRVLTDGIETPAAANFGADGHLYVAENTTGNIFSVNIDTGRKTVIASTPSNPDNIAVTADGELYVTHMSDNSISLVDDEDGTVRTLVDGGLALPGGIVVLGDKLFIADTFSIRRLNLDTGKLVDIERVVDRHGYPLSVGVVGDQIATSSWSSGTVQIYDPETGDSIRTIGGFVAPYGLAGGDLDTLYVAEFGTSCIIEVKLTDDARECALGDLAGPVGLVADDNGKLYISESLAGRITAFDPVTQTRSVIIEGLSGPEGVALDGDHLVVAEVGKERVVRVSLVDASIEEVGKVPVGLPGAEDLPPAFVPTGVAVRNGDIIVSSDVENAIYSFSR